MAVTFVGKATAINSEPFEDTPTITIPAAVEEGDQLYLFATADYYNGGIGDPVTPSGWTSLGIAKSGTTEAGVVFKKTATGSDANSSVAVSWTGTVHSWGLTVRAYRGDPLVNGEWVNGVELEVPVAIAAGDTFLAFAWTSGNLTSPITGTYPVEDFNQPGSYYSFGTMVTHSAPDAASSVSFAAASAQTGGSIPVWAFLIVSGEAPVVPPPTTYPPAPKEDPTFTDASLYRVRCHVSVDAGSVLRATSLLAVEADFQEDFPEDVSLDQTALHGFIEALTPDEVALTVYPAGTQNNERLNTYAGETPLGRMARIYPARIMGTVETLSGGLATSWTAAEAITYIFGQWSADYAWFRYADVPDLRTARPDGDYDGGKGRISTAVISIAQTRKNRLTMREILDQWLSAFPGTIVTVDTLGRVKIVPRDGPDADATAWKTLANDDAYSVTTGFPDQRSSVNGATVNNTGYTLETGVSLMQPSWFQIGPSGLSSLSDKWFTAPADTLNLSTQGPRSRFPAIWPVADADETIVDGVLTWKDDSDNLLLTGEIRYWSQGDQVVETNDTATEDEFAFEDVTDLPLDGAWYHVWTLKRTFSGPGGHSFFISVNGRYRADVGGVEFSVYDSKLTGAFWDALTWYASGFAIIAVDLDALGSKYGNSITKTGSFNLSVGSVLVDGDGNNALQTSVDAYGEREDTISITVFDLSVEQLQQIAMAHVLRNINPTTIRTVDQSVWNAFPVKFDDVGRLVALPSGEEGIVLSRSYSDDFGAFYGPGSMSSAVDIEVVQDVDYVTDPESAATYLHLNSGELWVMDDGNPSEVN